MSGRHMGMTLVELMVTLVLLGFVSVLVVTTLGGWQHSKPDEGALVAAHAHEQAVRTGVSVRLDQRNGRSVLFLPDGRVLSGDVDPLTGAPADAAR